MRTTCHPEEEKCSQVKFTNHVSWQASIGKPARPTRTRTFPPAMRNKMNRHRGEGEEDIGGALQSKMPFENTAGLEDRHMEPVGAVACDDEDTEEDAEVVSSSASVPSRQHPRHTEAGQKHTQRQPPAYSPTRAPVLTRQARDCLRARPFFGGRELTGDGEPRAGACLALAR